MEVANKLIPPRLLDYDDYRIFLRDFYDFKKTQRTGFSYRAFAAKAGFKSPNYLQLVMQGKRNLAPDTAAQVAQAMGLKNEEKLLFVALVEKALSSTPEQEIKARSRYFLAKKKASSKIIPREQREILARWYHLVIREMVTLPSFEADPIWISKKLGGIVSEPEVEATLKMLLNAGFLKRETNGKLVQSEPSIDTGDAFAPAFVLNYHQNTLSQWIRLLTRISPEDRELGLLNIPIRKEKIPELKKRMQAFQDEIIGWLQDEKDADTLVQLGTYLIPLTVDGV